MNHLKPSPGRNGLHTAPDNSARLKVLWRWGALGPYHIARMNAIAASPEVSLTVVETARLDDHNWENRIGDMRFDCVTLGSRRPTSKQELASRLAAYKEVIEKICPEIIVDGYGDLSFLLSAISHRARNRATKLVLWSETTAWDRRRRRLLEVGKKVLLQHFDGACVAGAAHLRYIESLGIPNGRAAIVGGCVDNDYFQSLSNRYRNNPGERQRVITAEPYFVFIGRLIPEKNVAGLLRSFAHYRSHQTAPWDLVLIGSGRDEQELRTVARGIPGVHFTGNLTPEAVIRYLAFSSAFVLPSCSEPWGLVVNEAMACSVPVLVSKACGCAHELVEDSVTGFTFDQNSVSELTALLHRVTTEAHLDRIGIAGFKRVQEFSPQRYGTEAVRLFKTILDAPRREPSLSAKALASVAGLRA